MDSIGTGYLVKMKASIYKPLEDSYLFKGFLEQYLSKNKVNSHLDMGTGSGILALTSAKIIGKDNVLAVDINKIAVKELAEKGINSIESNLFSNVMGKFDLITFNAPYLPLDKREPMDSRLATTGGKNGDEVSIKFLKQSKNHLNPHGKILLLISSLTPLKRIEKYGPEIVARKNLFAEELLILGFTE